MAEKTFEEERNNGWTYVGKNSKGEPKFRKYTNETLEYVKDFLDKKEIAYFVREQQALIFIYKDNFIQFVSDGLLFWLVQDHE